MIEKNRFAKQALWERDTRTVLIFSDINAIGGKVSENPVQLLDIYPTLLELCGLPPYKLAEGHSLASLIQDTNKNWGYPALSFYGKGNIAIRNSRFRLIQYEDYSIELYDLANDPNEWINLAKSNEHQEIIQKLKQFIPESWADLSKYSHYNFNEYFIEKSKKD